MSSLSKAFTSSVGRKFVMGFTGIFLVLFLIIHVSVNALIFFNDGGATFNKAAHFMSHNIILRILEVGLFVGLIAHVVQAIILTKQNKAARPQGYAVTNPAEKVTWYSRSMTLLGTLILLFLVIHLSHFWWPTKESLYLGAEEKSLFGEMQEVFSHPAPVIIYILGVISLSYHLMHGFQSAFRSIGCIHKKWTPVVIKIGFWFSIIVPLLFALMPIAIHLKWIK